MRYEESRKALQSKLIWLSFLVIAASAPALAQQLRKYSPENLISAAREIMTNARYCALITTDQTGRTSARAMDAFAPDEKMIVWLATNPRSRKVRKILRNPHVTLYYFDREHQAYVTLYGIARLVNDAKEKSRHWKEEWKAFYPDRDKSFLLIKVTPERLEVIDTSKGIVSQSPSWQAPSVRFVPKR